MSGFFGGGGGSATTDAGDLTSGVLAHERGGLEADVSAYSGLIKIASGSTSQATAGTDYQAVLTGLADIPGSDKLAEARGGLGSLTGLIKATSGTASAAVAGTDYQAPGSYIEYGGTGGTQSVLQIPNSSGDLVDSNLTYTSTGLILAWGGSGQQILTGGTSTALYLDAPSNHRIRTASATRVNISSAGLSIGNGDTNASRRLHVVDATNPQLRLDDGTYTCDMDVQNGALHLSFDGGSTWYSVNVTAV